MTTQSFTFDLNYLKSCAICASTDTTRYYLGGVCLQFDGKDLVAVSTDGHRMVCFNIDYAKEGDIKPFSMIIPKSVIDGIKVVKTIKNVSLLLVNDQVKPRLQYGDHVSFFDPIDGTFPEWQRVVPTTLSQVPAQYNPKYLMDFQKIKKLWHGKDVVGPSIAYNGTGPALINLNLQEGIDGFGVLMPYRDNETSAITHAPLWATGFKLPTPKAA